jgi:hypothetical protein
MNKRPAALKRAVQEHLKGPKELAFVRLKFAPQDRIRRMGVRP